LDARILQITDDHKIAAAEAIANYVIDISPEKIIPPALDFNLAKVVAEAVKLV
jgi:malic enzyme